MDSYGIIRIQTRDFKLLPRASLHPFHSMLIQQLSSMTGTCVRKIQKKKGKPKCKQHIPEQRVGVCLRVLRTGCI